MNLYYFKSRHGNFGDDLNQWLWPRLVRNLDVLTNADWLIGIGTIFDGRIDELHGTKLVAGSGYRPSSLGKPSMQQTVVAGVRGLLTCAELDIDTRYACGDPAIMLRQFKSPMSRHGGSVALIPHYQTASIMEMSRIAGLAGLDYIDPRWEVDRVIEAIRSADRVVTEAMHGAIVADAIGVPWQRVRLFNHVREDAESVDFKWKDWASMYDLDTTPAASFHFRTGGKSVVQRILKKGLRAKEAAALVAWLRIRSKDAGFQLSSEKKRAAVEGNFSEVIGRILARKS